MCMDLNFQIKGTMYISSVNYSSSTPRFPDKPKSSLIGTHAHHCLVAPRVTQCVTGPCRDSPTSSYTRDINVIDHAFSGIRIHSNGNFSWFDCVRTHPHIHTCIWGSHRSAEVLLFQVLQSTPMRMSTESQAQLTASGTSLRYSDLLKLL